MSNEAADMLRELCRLVPEITNRVGSVEGLVDATLADERRATVNRIRSALHDRMNATPSPLALTPGYLASAGQVSAILDAEAQR